MNSQSKREPSPNPQSTNSQSKREPSPNPLTEDFLYSDLGTEKSQRQKAYQDLVIDDIVKKSYAKKIWANRTQTNNEKVKINYHLKHLKP